MLHRRQFMALGAAAVVSACAAPGRVAMPEGTTLIVLRHGDRDDENLNDKGRARAAALVPALAGVPIDAVYSPGIKRNLDTAAPLAQARGLTVQRIPAENPAARLMAEGAGKTIVWVGNKGNLASIWKALGAPDPAPLQYGDLYFVTPARFGSPRVERMRFGP